MRSVFPIVVGLLCLVGALLGLIELRTVWEIESKRAALVGLPTGTSPAQEAEAVRGFEQALSSKFAGREALIELANVYRALGNDANNFREQRWLYCRALHYAGRSVAAGPRSAASLVNWSNLRQLLGRVNCSESFTTGSFDDALRVALEAEPHNVRTSLAAGLVYLWGGRRDAALDAFHRSVRFDTGLSQSQEEFILGELREPADLGRVLPPRFPQIARWSRMLLERDEPRWQGFYPVLEKLQSSALDLAVAEFEGGVVTTPAHHRRLLDLLPYVVGDTVRKRLDVELARSFGILRDPPAAGYLAKRAELSELEVVRSVLRDDTRPGHSSLSLWNSSESVALDAFYTSIGFFLPPGQSVELIELTNTRGDGVVKVASVELYVSNDNISWRKIGSDIKSVRLDTLKRILIKPAEEEALFWKVHYRSGDRERRFSNSLNGIIRLFGRSSRAGGFE